MAFLEDHTMAPKVADSDNTLSTNAFSGSTTLPVNRNNRMKVAIAITPSTQGRCA